MDQEPGIAAARDGRCAQARIGQKVATDHGGPPRSLTAEIMAFVVVVDANDNAAAAFYTHRGFIVFASVPMTLYRQLAEAAKQLGIPTR